MKKSLLECAMAYKKFVRKFQIFKLLKDQKNIKESDDLLLRNY